MKKLDPETDGTDTGWIYGIVEADSQKVLASGNVASCANCHADAKNDRQFGPKISVNGPAGTAEANPQDKADRE